ncbi:xanthine dehydrogenase family protein molybdopterin-binding subunit [Chitinophaga pinensis]|uniref:Xanthine dehydrogenase family protein molybdopterin-binding subunit n=1 Tax=Chitinophaga pinensis TaxID=79329 RepID=A0A5C6LL79_9BACT|nr:xanthine dehydrogenase family protein molybdopterin-binding subunit [Chitinophaga pinensis]
MFEPSGKQSLVLYKAPLREVTYNVTTLTRGTPTFMRAPGETPGTFALESAMDEIAYKLKMDPVEFRIANHTSSDPMKGHEFSSDFLVDCYRIGAEDLAGRPAVWNHGSTGMVNILWDMEWPQPLIPRAEAQHPLKLQ